MRTRQLMFFLPVLMAIPVQANGQSMEIEICNDIDRPQDSRCVVIVDNSDDDLLPEIGRMQLGSREEPIIFNSLITRLIFREYVLLLFRNLQAVCWPPSGPVSSGTLGVVAKSISRLGILDFPTSDPFPESLNR